MDKPDRVFGRADEWLDLAQYAEKPGLGVVSGRRRHGKSFLLRELASQRASLYHQAIEVDRNEGLRRFADALASHHGWPAAPAFADWEQALRAASTGDQFVMLDEFPYLVRAAPELLSIIQLLVDERRQMGERLGLLLCGSALSVMSEVLGGGSPLHGRAGLDLVVREFDYRSSAEFWQAPNERVAFLIDSVVGGAPGYSELMDGRIPATDDFASFGEWLATGPLNPSHVLFSEDDYLLREEMQINDRAQYLSILHAIAQGARSTSAIAAALQRDARSLHHALNGLTRAGFVESIEDALRDQRPIHRLTDPIVRFCRLVTRPNVDRLEQRRWPEVIAERQAAIRSGILGPHFEHLAREWTRRFATDEQLGGVASRVAPAVLSDPKAKTSREVDVVALASGYGERPKVLAIGEAKYTEAQRTIADVARLDHLRNLITATRSAQFETGSIKILLFSANGFDDELRAMSRSRNDLVLIDLAELYGQR
jgi:uncharacterized protein